jgi:hypothetical protein
MTRKRAASQAFDKQDPEAAERQVAEQETD